MAGRRAGRCTLARWGYCLAAAWCSAADADNAVPIPRYTAVGGAVADRYPPASYGSGELAFCTNQPGAGSSESLSSGAADRDTGANGAVGSVAQCGEFDWWNRRYLCGGVFLVWLVGDSRRSSGAYWSARASQLARGAMPALAVARGGECVVCGLGAGLSRGTSGASPGRADDRYRCGALHTPAMASAGWRDYPWDCQWPGWCTVWCGGRAAAAAAILVYASDDARGGARAAAPAHFGAGWWDLYGAAPPCPALSAEPD